METIKSFTIRLPLSQWEALHILAAKQQRSMKSIVNECVLNYLKKFEKNLQSDLTEV